MSESNKRAQGQLWIDKNSPYALRYHVNDETYQVETTRIFEEYGHESFKAGEVIALGKGGYRKAQFPEDLEAVIGVCAQDSSKDEPFYIIKSGLLVLDLNSESFINGDLAVFEQNGTSAQNEDDESIETEPNETESDETEYPGDEIKDEVIGEKTEINNYPSPNPIAPEKPSNYIGAPVYWFIGRSYAEHNDNYNVIHYMKCDDDTYGKLTIQTPSGDKWIKDSIDNYTDNTFNVGYSNLPTIGRIINIKDGKVYIDLNISRFDSTIEWSFPYFKVFNGSDAGLFEGNSSIIIRHGLFPSMTHTNKRNENNESFRARCFVDVVALDEDNDTENIVYATVDNFYGEAEVEKASYDKCTIVTVKTPDTKRYCVNGRVSYKFNRV